MTEELYKKLCYDLIYCLLTRNSEEVTSFVTPLQKLRTSPLPPPPPHVFFFFYNYVTVQGC